MGDLEQDYSRHFSAAAPLLERASKVLPGGLTHDVRHFDPHPIYVARASGSRKWTEEGHELIDYGMGHGALLLGHVNPAVRRAVETQIALGTHFAAPHKLEVEWAERVTRMVPSAEMVRFTSSGTEATLLAIRLARAFTGRPRLLKLHGHFHGWHDEVMVGRPSAGANQGTMTQATEIPANDVDAVRRELETEQYAVMIVEPSGAGWGQVPLADGYLQAVRDLTRRHGTVLIFDEVITGFRLAPGGAQEHFGVTPDMSTLAKILAGGLPGGAVAGRRDIVSQMDFAHKPRVSQNGTYNANPLCAAAGIAALDQLADGAPQRRAAELAARACDGFNQTLAALDIPGCAWRMQSMFHVYVGEGCPIWVEDGEVRGEFEAATLLKRMPREDELRQAMMVRGVDLFHDGGFMSAVHTDADVDQTVGAFEDSLRSLW
jgi:glutamate-1-semialdehyde 2,1-aminomutase